MGIARGPWVDTDLVNAVHVVLLSLAVLVPGKQCCLEAFGVPLEVGHQTRILCWW